MLVAVAGIVVIGAAIGKDDHQRDPPRDGHDACERLFDSMWGDVGTREVMHFPPSDDVQASLRGFVYLETGSAEVRLSRDGPQETVEYECDLLLLFEGDVFYRSLVVDGEVVYEVVVEDDELIVRSPGG